MKTLRSLTLALALAAAFGTVQAQGLRPEVGKPLQQAGEFLKAGKAREALAKVREAESVPNRTPAEQLTIDRMKAAAAQRAGDFPTAIQALESLHPKVGAAEQGQIAEQIASAYAQSRNNAKATEWMNKAIAAGNSVEELRFSAMANLGRVGALVKLKRTKEARDLLEKTIEVARKREALGYIAELLREDQGGRAGAADAGEVGGSRGAGAHEAAGHRRGHAAGTEEGEAGHGQRARTAASSTSQARSMSAPSWAVERKAVS